MDKKKLTEALNKALEEKGKRKFTQSVELMVNFKGLDFNKPENRLNLDVVLPKGKGKEPKVMVFAEGQIALDAKNAGAEVKGEKDIPKMAADKSKLKKLAEEYEFLAQPQFMVPVGKHMGQVLGKMGKLPKPIVGNVAAAVEQAKSRVRVATKGKYLPVVQCLIGNETMSVSDLEENVESVYEKIRSKVDESNFKSIYVKLTMGKPFRVI